MKDDNNINAIISELEKTADNIRRYKEIHPQRRPIVIEFSGSPKSGKSSCINSLTIFLKRNGLKVSIVHEHASICPVTDKKSPMFNIWTVSMTLANMIGILEQRPSQYDVLILDRGIFDALCWFQWLVSNKSMERRFLEKIEHFLLCDEFTKLIDIVYVFKCDQEVSIEREYATLLTKKTGTIMKPTVLVQYLKAIYQTIETHARHFRQVEVIDTSKKNQNEVSKEVTTKTLSILAELIMERIGYVEKPSDFSQNPNGFFGPFSRYAKHFELLAYDYRFIVEESKTFIQPIPIAVFVDKVNEHIFIVKKNERSAEVGSPERNKILVYIGGHTRIEDKSLNSHDFDFLLLCKETLAREVKEEIGLSIVLDKSKPFVIYTPDSDHSARHIAICFIVECDMNEFSAALDPMELTLNRGSSKSGRFMSFTDIAKNQKDLESWSKQILIRKFNISLTDSDQISLFDDPD